jgi:transposase
VLASCRDRGCHASVETIRQALIGNDREEHIFALSYQRRVRLPMEEF